MIFDLATGRCIASRCPPEPSASPGSGVPCSGARGDTLLSALPGSPALLLPPSLRQSSGGSCSRRPRPTEGGAAPRTDTRRQAGPGARSSLTCGRCRRRRPAPDLGTSPSGTSRGWTRVPPARPPERGWGLRAASPSQYPRPRGNQGLALLGTRCAKFPFPGNRRKDLTLTHLAPGELTNPRVTPGGCGIGGSPYCLQISLLSHLGQRSSQRSGRRAIRGAH